MATQADPLDALRCLYGRGQQHVRGGKGECACMGCANRHLTWAEWECWRKYGQDVNGQARV